MLAEMRGVLEFSILTVKMKPDVVDYCYGLDQIDRSERSVVRGYSNLILRLASIIGRGGRQLRWGLSLLSCAAGFSNSCMATLRRRGILSSLPWRSSVCPARKDPFC